MNRQNLFKALSIPVFILIITFTYHMLWKFLGWPMGEDLVNVITGFFNRFGLWMVFISSIFESALLLGNYFPGGIVIFLSVIVAGHDIQRVIFTVMVVSIGFCIGYTLDYLLGKYGWYKLLVRFGLGEQLENAQVKMARHSFKAIMSSYWEVNIASITATAAGILQINFRKFFIESTTGIIIWNIFWGTLVFTLGKNALNLLFNWRYIIPIVSVWLLIIIAKQYWDNRKIKV